jgi:peptidyl-prolyl cis-trans isomerase A (cyclophilin A)
MSASIFRHLTRRTTLAAAGLLLASTLTSAWAQTTQRVRLDTDIGSITLELDAAKAPITVRNFVQYVQDGHYNGTVFHRVISDFMIQAGGYNETMQERKTREPITIESRNGLKNTRGSIAMARMSAPNSATAQFFINVKDNDFLDQANSRDGHGYAVFGRVVAGMDVVDRIRQVPTGNRGGHQNVPLQPVTILKATLEN